MFRDTLEGVYMTYTKCSIEACGSDKDLVWHEDGDGTMIRMCRSCHNKVLALKRRGFNREEAMKVLSVSTDVDFANMTTSNTRLLSARVPISFLGKKRKGEKDTDFIIRAIESLDKQGDPFLVSLAKKMVRLFVDKGMKMKLDNEEIEVVKRLYES